MPPAEPLLWWFFSALVLVKNTDSPTASTRCLPDIFIDILKKID
jgi:hypothetical protein